MFLGVGKKRELKNSWSRGLWQHVCFMFKNRYSDDYLHT